MRLSESELLEVNSRGVDFRVILYLISEERDHSYEAVMSARKVIILNACLLPYPRHKIALTLGAKNFLEKLVL